MHLEKTITGAYFALITSIRGTYMSGPGAIYVGSSVHPYKKIMVGINEHSVLLSLQDAGKLATHIRSTIKRLQRCSSRFQEDDNE